MPRRAVDYDDDDSPMDVRRYQIKRTSNGLIIGLAIGGASTLLVLSCAALWGLQIYAAIQKNAQPPSNTMSLETYLATRPDTPTRFRLEAMLSDKYVDEYTHGNWDFYSIELTETPTSKRVFAYIRKLHPDAARAIDLLKDGKSHLVTVELRSVGPGGLHLDPTAGDVADIIRWEGGQ